MKKFYFMAVVAMIAVCTSCGNTEKATPATENDTIVSSVDTISNAIDVDSVDNVSTEVTI